MSTNQNDHSSGRHDYGVRNVGHSLHETLAAYIEAQYHIRNEGLIRERHLLLDEPESIMQRPYVEATPIYQAGGSYGGISIPHPARELLSELAAFENPSVGIFDPPYVHQVRALETFFAGDDLIVATGTGSGKTESFLMPILGELAMEVTRPGNAANLPGMRALLLYPLNALVSDQLARVRRLFGDQRVAERLSQGRKRRVRFGMYTSRTPYPGARNGDRDQRDVKPLFEQFYLDSDGNRGWIEVQRHKEQLQPRGRWPRKDLANFYGRQGTRWANRLLTQSGDTELLTRHEMQLTCPDILITNYSMLEYMMLRPIERDLFAQTRQWLEHDPDGKLILVLDEAHMYRGAGGAEVAMLIRRLRARLNLPRERFRCILTSASLGQGEEAEQAVLQFAQHLTGLESTVSHSIHLVPAMRETRAGAAVGSNDEATALAAFDLMTFQRFELGSQYRRDAFQVVSRLAGDLGWSEPDSAERLPQYLFDRLSGWGPVEQMIATISGAATEFPQLASQLFPRSGSETRERATETLLALATFARQDSQNQGERVLMPTRLHLFFRGLPAQHVCTNRRCQHRRDRSGQGPYLLGRVHTRPVVRCECGHRAYELLTHRRCGTAFLRGFTEGPTGQFLWHEPSGLVGVDPGAPLCQVELLVEHPHQDAIQGNEVVPVWLDTATGRLAYQQPEDIEAWLRLFLPTVGPEPTQRRFARCPVCRKSWGSRRSEIMDLVTKGEAPFSNLVKTQVLTQPPRRSRSPQSPNEGRKVLLFSDGRQKAARLARDIPREVEQDAFRQVLVLAVRNLETIAGEVRPDSSLYVAFVSAASENYLAFFDGNDQRNFLRHGREFRDWYGGALEEAWADRWNPAPIPPRFWEALLRQLCSRFYALSSTTLGYISPTRTAHRRFTEDLQSLFAHPDHRQLQEQAMALSVAWIDDALQDYLAFGGDGITDLMRSVVAGYYGGHWGTPESLSTPFRGILESVGGITRQQTNEICRLLIHHFCGEQANRDRHFLNPNRIRIVVGLDDVWYQCQDCTHLSPVSLFDSCPNCGGNRVQPLSPAESDYLRSRKGFWRTSMADCLAGRSRPSYICAEEHTAQLSYRDRGEVYATTEEFELRFQDIVLEGRENDGPIDVLSCTTTMEVGVDIGSLVAVGLRNVPPQRENYQQRAGRAGRRGSAVSTVVTFSQEGPHDSYYYGHPAEIVSGTPRRPVVHVRNPRIVRRHVHAYLIQTFFHELIDQGNLPPGGSGGRLESALGDVATFFLGSSDNFTLTNFRTWILANILDPAASRVSDVVAWLPSGLSQTPEGWVRRVSQQLIDQLSDFAVEMGSDPPAAETQLLDFLFDRGVLPTYAFPTDLCSFQIEEYREHRVSIVEQPQQALNQALSEYAPGRLLVINKQTYRSGGVAASVLPHETDRASLLFQRTRDYIFCPECSFVQIPDRGGMPLPDECPLCHYSGDLRRETMVTPQVFHPEGAGPISQTDRDQEFTYASSAQLPVPVGVEDLGGATSVGAHALLYSALDQRLVVANRGDEETRSGFWVCDCCGASYVAEDSSPPPHPRRRPYYVQTPPGQPSPGQCQGTFHRVFLGNIFRSDLMLLRMSIEEPFGQNLADRVFRCVLEDSLRTFGEALLLAASRHMDIDPSEMSSGFRLLPQEDGAVLQADVYLFDTLAGGAGYAEQAGHELGQVFDVLADLLSGCTCDTSCQDCLRHYGNRFYHESLDRHLGLALLNYIRDGVYPATDNLAEQAGKLEPLRRMCQLDGYRADINVSVGTHTVPLLVERDGNRAIIGTYHGLLSDQSLQFEHPLNSLRGTTGAAVLLENDYRLTRNLPGTYREVRRILGE